MQSKNHQSTRMKIFIKYKRDKGLWHSRTN